MDSENIREPTHSSNQEHEEARQEHGSNSNHSNSEGQQEEHKTTMSSIDYDRVGYILTYAQALKRTMGGPNRNQTHRSRLFQYLALFIG